jgi:dephospho-CoA kinase
MIVIGLTGSIAMGKSETAKMFAQLGVPVFDADSAVHTLYAPGGGAVDAVAREFPQALRDGAIDRSVLSRLVSGDPASLAKLEKIVHPLVREEQRRFLERCRREARPLAVVDIPLLLETGRQHEVDRIVVVSAPADIQRSRALARPGMSEAKLDAILARQMPDSEKRRHAHFIVDSGQGFEHAFAQVRHIVESLTAKT